jgi:ketosteroid isomerase-like protein
MNKKAPHRVTLRHVLSTLAGATCLLAATVSATSRDSISAMIERNTQAFSDASLHGDQAALNSFLDSSVIFSDGSGAISGNVTNDADAVSALLKEQTQALADAIERGDSAQVKRAFDDDAFYTNVDGVFSSPPAVPPKGVSLKVTVTDWVLHHAGDVAVASFIATESARDGRRVRSEKFRAVDTWIKRGSTWKLMASQAIPIPQDPAAVTLTADELDAYAGTYTGAQGTPIAITHDGNGLSGSSNGTKLFALEAETRDVFFTRGSFGARKIFQRDPDGHITGYVSRNAGGDLVFIKGDPPAAAAPTPPAIARELTPTNLVVHHSASVAVACFIDVLTTHVAGGQTLHARFRSTETWIKRKNTWKLIASQTLNMRPDPPAITLAPDTLNDYTGTYRAGSHITVTISRKDDALASSVNGHKAVPLQTEVRDVLFTPGAWRTRAIFQRDTNGRVTGYVNRSDGYDLVFTKQTTPVRK